ncbi:MAG: hypothetical protein JWP31_1059 [Aeromicrobium sp.]|nr:hypothetical protein [Aeromicrobium sp.]
MRPAGAAAAVLALMAVTACGGSDQAPADDATPSATTAAPVAGDSAACRLLTAGDREALAGGVIDTVAPAESDLADAQCRWTAGSTIVQVTSLPADRWVESLPQVIAALEQSGAKLDASDRRQLAQVKKIATGASRVSGERACGLFATMAEIAGAAKGSKALLSYAPLSSDVLSASGQTCTDATFTSVVLARPGLEKSKVVEASVLLALRTAHDRAKAAV